MKSEDAPYTSLCKELGDKKVLDALVILLQRGAFQSGTEASIDFPRLVQHPVVDSPSNQPSGADSINCESAIVEKAVSGSEPKKRSLGRCREGLSKNGMCIHCLYLGIY